MYQFIRLETYSRKVAKEKKSSWTAREIVNEAIRKPEASKHVEKPLAPNLIYGEMPDKVLDEAEVRLETESEVVKLKNGKTATRKVREDKIIMLAGVASYPIFGQHYDVFKEKTLNFLKEKYGSNLRSVVEHLDEAHPHLHFYVIADKVSKTRELHEGIVAQDLASKAVKSGDNTQAPQSAYVSAMKGLQDSFQRNVAIYAGLSRKGDGSPRLTRKEALERREARNKVAESIMLADKYLKKSRKEFKEGYAKGIAQSRKEAVETATTFGERIGAGLAAINTSFKTASDAELKEALELLEKERQEKLILKQEINDLVYKANKEESRRIEAEQTVYKKSETVRELQKELDNETAKNSSSYKPVFKNGRSIGI